MLNKSLEPKDLKFYYVSVIVLHQDNLGTFLPGFSVLLVLIFLFFIVL